MSDKNIPPQKKDKKKKKKSFLNKMSKVFGGRKINKSSDNSSSSTDSRSNNFQSSDFDGSLSSSSRTTSARNSPAKTTGDEQILEQQLLQNVDHSNEITVNTLQKNSTITVSSGQVSKIINDENLKAEERQSNDQDIDDLRLLTELDNNNLSRRGSDRNFEAKQKFMEEKKSSEISTISLEEKNKLGMQSKIDITPEKMLKKIQSKNKNVSELTKKLMEKEKKINCDNESTDSDESDSTTTYTSDDENIDIIESEIIEKNIKDLYFTTGKFITYFFLEMERKWYNPKEEIYSYIKYHNKDGNSLNKGIKKI